MNIWSFDGAAHIPLMTLPGMRDRTMRIGSAGKTFSLTGWKIGYVTAGAELSRLVARAHQNLTFATAPNLQRAVAVGLAKDAGFFAGLASSMQSRRDQLAAGLAETGLSVLPTTGTYFITADFTPLGFDGDDVAFCRHITEQAGVTAIPMSVFYEAPDRHGITPGSPSASGRRCWTRPSNACGGISLLPEARAFPPQGGSAHAPELAPVPPRSGSAAAVERPEGLITDLCPEVLTACAATGIRTCLAMV